jgi:release factor glutamine methyltransferase
MPALAAGDPDTLIAAGASVREALRRGASRLEAAGIERARVDAEWLLADVLGVSRGRLGLESGRRLDAAAAARYAALLRRRLAREPLQHIVGTQAFRTLSVRVSPAALVPRPETELLAEWALELLPPAPAPLVVDVGTGTGCIACALAAERPDARVIALDVSASAVGLARQNVLALGLGARVSVVGSDLFTALDAAVRADLVVANPPYLPTAIIPTLSPEVARFDPRQALDGGADGLELIRRLASEAPARLAPGGALVLETAGGEQALATVALLRSAGFVDVRTRPDLAGVDRFVAGRMASCRHDS